MYVASREFYNILMLVVISHAIFGILGGAECHHHPDNLCRRLRIVVNTEERADETDH